MKTLRKISIISSICLVSLLGFSCSKKDKTAEPSQVSEILSAGMNRVKSMATDGAGLSNVKAILKTARGNIIIRFYPKQAPNTVARITDLIEQGFYNGLEFHRVVDNFVIQTGDPTGNGDGGTGVNLKAEFNSLQHVRGTVGLARQEGNENSGDSQFYITLATATHLDGKYTIFGQVTDGLGTISKIKKGDKVLSAVLAIDEGK